MLLIAVTAGVEDSVGAPWLAQSLAGPGRTCFSAILNNSPTHSSAVGAWPGLAASRVTGSIWTGRSLCSTGDGGNRSRGAGQGDRG